MTQSELEAMLKESELMSYGLGKDGFKFFSACGSFAKLIAEREREECARLCEEERINAVHYSATTQSNWLARKIRAK